jgi:1,2-diacylglycerol 3-alpha-glucosyltransferase
MNIGIVTTWFPAGAGYVSKAYRYVLEKEHSVFIYARTSKNMQGDPEWDDPQVTWAPKHYLTTGIWEGHFRKWIKRNRIDLILFNEQRYWKPVLIAKSLGVCVGAYVDYYTQRTVPAFAVYDFLICNTRRHASVFDWHPACHYIPWGTDVEKFKPATGCPTRILTFLHSAGWCGEHSTDNEYMDRRGTRIALTAFSKVIGDCRFLLFSQSPLEKCSKVWQELIASDQRIEFRFGTFEPFPFHEGDIYVYPSRLEGIGLSLPEALSSGLAAITTDCAPMNEFVSDGVNGRLVKVSRYLARPDAYYWPESVCDVKQLETQMQEYVDKPENVVEHRMQARQKAIANFDWKFNAAHLTDILQSSKCSAVDRSTNVLCRQLDFVMEPTVTQRALLMVKTFEKWLKCKVGMI